MAKEQSGNKHERQDGKRYHGKPTIKLEQDNEDPQQEKDVLHEVDQDRGEHFVDILNIVGQSGHQSSQGIRVEKGDGEALEVRKELHPKLMHGPLSCDLHGVDLEEVEPKIGCQDEDNEKGNMKDPLNIFLTQSEEVVS